jgi:hypothetical protein
MSKKENYGNVYLDWGNYPMGAHHDMGGCPATAAPPLADAEDVARAAHAHATAEQRGGNNPYQFESCPERLRYEIGTGCMNPACHCKNCQGDCKCGAGGSIVEGFGGNITILGHDLRFWLIAVGVAALVYMLMSGKPLKIPKLPKLFK